MSERQLLRRDFLTLWAEWCFIDGDTDKSWYYLIVAESPSVVGLALETYIRL